MLTAISVARQCGMVAPSEHVLLVHVSPPEPGKPAAHITWEKADAPTGTGEDDGDDEVREIEPHTHKKKQKKNKERKEKIKKI